MDHYERSKLADAIKEETFQPGSYIIREVRTFQYFNIKIYRVKREIFSI
jgi:hypothetical protein